MNCKTARYGQQQKKPTLLLMLQFPSTYLENYYLKKYVSIFPRKVKATSLPEGWPQPDPSFARSDATPWGTFPSPQLLNTPCYSPPGLWTLADLAGSGLDSYWAQKVLSLITTVNCLNQAIFVHFYEGRRSLPTHVVFEEKISVL